ncbi:MAG: MerR family DNA-binding transcriptional regulator, partial [Gordonibacter urolithinfaciens]
MLQIGEFSRLSRISVRMLRHYDQVGLLKPAEQDAQTGYRRYAVSQLAEANRITVL